MTSLWSHTGKGVFLLIELWVFEDIQMVSLVFSFLFFKVNILKPYRIFVFNFKMTCINDLKHFPRYIFLFVHVLKRRVMEWKIVAHRTVGPLYIAVIFTWHILLYKYPRDFFQILLLCRISLWYTYRYWLFPTVLAWNIAAERWYLTY